MEQMKSLCAYFGKQYHKDHWPCDMSVLLGAECGEDAPVEVNGSTFSNVKLHSLSDPEFLREPSKTFLEREHGVCTCYDCLINDWFLDDMGLAAKERESGKRQVWIFFGNFWKYDHTHPKIPATSVIVKKGNAMKEFPLKPAYDPDTAGTSWDHEQVDTAVRSECSRLNADPLQLEVYVGCFYDW